MLPQLRHYLSALLLCAMTSSGIAQSLDAEKAKLAKLERQNQNLSALNTDILNSLTEIETEVSTLEAQSPPSSALDKTATVLAAAQALNDEQPSQINKDKLEMAQFKHALAFRKQSKSNPALARLKKEQNELKKAVDSNAQKIVNNDQLISSQQALITELKDQQETARQAWLIKQEQQKSAVDENRLKKVEQERQAALSEVKRLRAMLAQQQTQQEAKKRQQLRKTQQVEQRQAKAVAAVSPSNSTQFESFVFLNTNKEIAAEKARIATALQTKSNGDSKFSKFITIKTYVNNTLVDTKTKRLDHRGNFIYQNTRITMPVSATVFVVGQDEWRVNLPELDKGVPAGQASSYVITLDLRNSKLPFLTLYAD